MLRIITEFTMINIVSLDSFIPYQSFRNIWTNWGFIKHQFSENYDWGEETRSLSEGVFIYVK